MKISISLSTHRRFLFNLIFLNWLGLGCSPIPNLSKPLEWLLWHWLILQKSQCQVRAVVTTEILLLRCKKNFCAILLTTATDICRVVLRDVHIKLILITVAYLSSFLHFVAVQHISPKISLFGEIIFILTSWTFFGDYLNFYIVVVLTTGCKTLEPLLSTYTSWRCVT